MKKVAIRKFDEFGSKEILETITYAPEPNKGITYEEMRKRFRLMDVIESIDGDAVIFEDNDYQLLVKLMKQTQFRAMHRDLLTVLTDIEKAEEVSAAELLK